ncbi:MAG: AMP-binding protein, partial [Woeseiaceae bacterium]
MNRIWLSSYPEGVPAEVAPPGHRSVRDMIESSLREYAARPAYTNMGTTLTFQDLDRLSRQFAAYLQKGLGLMKGERVAIMLPNVLQYPVALCGCFRAGLVVVNVNPLYTKRELRHQLADSGARAIVILENFATTLEQVVGDTAIQHVIVTGVGDLLRWPKGNIVNFVLRHVRKAVPPYRLPGHVRMKAALQQGAQLELDEVELGFGDIAFLQYTGGTTGLAKGAMLSHRNMVYNVHQGQAWQGGAFEDLERIVVVTALPLYHIFSLQSNCLSIMLQGGENILITNPRDMPGFVRELAKHRFSYFTGVNTLFAGLLNTPGFAELDFSSLRLTIGGGMAVQEAVSRRWK